MLHARKDYQRIQDPKNLIPSDEPVFLMRAQDKLFITMLVIYRMLAKMQGCSPKMLQTISKHIEITKLYNIDHPTKIPDL
jgi:hypothetical protein